MKDSTAVSSQWCMLVNFLGGAILFDFWFRQYKVIKYKFVKISKNHRDYDKKMR